MFLINLKDVTVTWLFKMVKFVESILTVHVSRPSGLIVCVYTQMRSEGPPTA